VKNAISMKPVVAVDGAPQGPSSMTVFPDPLSKH